MRRIIHCIRLVLGLRSRSQRQAGASTPWRQRCDGRAGLLDGKGCFLPPCRKVGGGSESRLAGMQPSAESTPEQVKIGSSHFELSPLLDKWG